MFVLFFFLTHCQETHAKHSSESDFQQTNYFGSRDLLSVVSAAQISRKVV